ncbi:CdaR family protein [Bariatricus sp. SGI.161]|uniref:CdaR family protein n=1 Tax=Bariatricus sp. SGI.161 TaxID=3420550 RepID=UPI002A766D21|nr:CdaR family protein [Lachnospiraceae bacterium]MDY2613089.1 CdaR family protein [Lachnospiraceae bacterium]
MKKRLTVNFGLKILAFFIALFMWLIVVNIDDPVTDKTYTGIPVQVINEEVVTSANRTYQIVDDTQEVSVTVTAQRSVLNDIKAEDIVAIADMKEISLGTQIPIEVKIEGYKYDSAVSNPRNLQIQIDDEAKNNFPITPTTLGTVREGYVIGELKANPEKVTIRGPKTVIDSINRVVAEVDVSGLSSDTEVEARLVLYDANNNVIDQSLLANNLGKEGLTVEVKLHQIKSVKVELDTAMVSAAEGYKISGISVEPQEVRISGSKSALTKVTEITIPASALTAINLTQRTERSIDISQYLPEDVALVDENADNVVVTISVEKPGAKNYEVSTSSITVNNLDSRLELSYGTVVDLEIQIKGPSEVLSVFSIAKKVSIDLKDYTKPGTYTVPVTVELPAGCSLVNEVSVEVILDEKQEQEE